MPKHFSPTSLSIYDKCCPKALQFYAEQKRDASMNEFEVEGPELAEIGIVFHACVHAAALAIARGEPPHPKVEATAVAFATRILPERAWEARSMAMEFIEWWQFPERYDFEHGLAFNDQWKVVPWESDERKLRLIFDSIGITTEDDPTYGEIRVAEAQDYKTGWGAKESELDSIQMDAYVAAMKALYENEVDAIRIKIIATRFKRVFTRLYVFENESDMAAIEERVRKLQFYMRSGDESDGRARTGPGCLRCNFRDQCETFQTRVQTMRAAGAQPDKPDDEVARDYAVLSAKSKDLEAHLKTAAAIKPITVDGELLGFHPEEKRQLKDPLAPIKIWLSAAQGVDMSEGAKSVINGFALASEPGAAQLDKVAEKCFSKLGYKSKAEAKRRLSDEHTQDVPILKWGWKKVEAKG